MTDAPVRPPSGAEVADLPSVPVARLLANTSVEIAKLSRLILLVEGAIFDLAEEGRFANGRNRDDLCHFDFILQTLTEITGVLARSAETLSEQNGPWIEMEAVLGPVKLAHLRHALAYASSAPPAIGRESKNIEFF